MLTAGPSINATAAAASGSVAAVSQLAVYPASDLVDHQLVELDGFGLPPGAPVFIEQCPASSPDGSCDSNRVDAEAVDDSGHLDARIGLGAIVSDSTGEAFDCRSEPGGCVVKVLSVGDRDLASAPLQYDPLGPLDVGGVLTIDPNLGLIDGQNITLTTTHLRPFAVVYAYLCSADAVDCQDLLFGDDDVDVAGGVSATFRVRAQFTSGSGRVVDCRSKPCTVNVAEDPFIDDPIRAPIPLDPGAPLAPLPQIVAEPTSGLPAGASGARVGVRGTNWFDEELVLVRECLDSPPITLLRCSSSDWRLVRTDEQGQFELSVRVKATGRLFGGGPFDCRRDACAVFAFRIETGDSEYTSIPLAFDRTPTSPGLGPTPTLPSAQVASPRFAG